MEVLSRLAPLRMILAVLLVLSALRASGQGTYTAIDLGSFGGSYTIPKSINNVGQVVGYGYLTGNGTQHAFLYSGGVLTDLGATAAYGINDSGQVVGVSGNNAFLYSGGVMTDLGTFGGTYAIANAINAAGVIVGQNDNNAVVYSGGTLTFLSTPNRAAGNDINASGQIAVVSNLGFPNNTVLYHAFLYSGGVLTDQTPTANWNSNPAAINSSGVMVGDSGGRAMLFAGGTATDLGTLGGGGAQALDINDLGQIVGSAQIASGAYHSFLYSGGVMTDLNPLVTMPAGWSLQAVNGINNSGWMMGTGTQAGITHAFLIIPIPEPSTVSCLGLGLALLGGRALRRRRA